MLQHTQLGLNVLLSDIPQQIKLLVFIKSPCQKTSFVSNVYLPNYFVIDDQLDELQTEKDITRIFKGGNFLQQNQDRRAFKEALQAIGRIDLVVKLEKYLTTCKL